MRFSHPWRHPGGRRPDARDHPHGAKGSEDGAHSVSTGFEGDKKGGPFEIDGDLATDIRPIGKSGIRINGGYFAFHRDIFDYLGPGEAAALSRRLTALLRPGGLMMALFTTEPRHEAASRRYIIADADHLRHRPAPGARWARTVWPLRDIEVLLAPLEVRQSHLLAHRQREMLLRRPSAPGKDG